MKVKKLTAVFAAAIILAIALCSCSGGSGKKLSDVYSTIKSQVSLSEMNEFKDVSSLDRYYGITEDLVDDFAGGINNSGVNQEELVMVKAKNADAAVKIEEALQNRYKSKLNEQKNYNAEQAEMIEKCSVDVDGMYVSMLISPNASQIKTIYKSELGLS